tara:strand:- start:46 stop:201 length:156 start_codon:yes stop_codon:yes gene_type:complete
MIALTLSVCLRLHQALALALAQVHVLVELLKAIHGHMHEEVHVKEAFVLAG